MKFPVSKLLIKLKFLIIARKKSSFLPTSNPAQTRKTTMKFEFALNRDNERMPAQVGVGMRTE
ncbi:MAG: hypothetical protein CO189_11325 [candidate division Zixibacteria bacterium CG_4_9_14_3_um_filter_46_8]|nr:MAG: hypothetical protein CO189_11325 [candidate division Zixibacteria bacterium CG_4_9_14_3_um_filter_46_8]